MIELALAAALVAANGAGVSPSSVGVGEGDVWILASMALGETGLLFGGPGEAERWVMWTCRNRVESGDFPDDYWTVIEQGFYGHRKALEPTMEMLALAREVMGASAEEDPTGGCYYVMSGDDMAAHGWSEASAVRVMEAGRWGLYFFREAPWSSWAQVPSNK